MNHHYKQVFALTALLLAAGSCLMEDFKEADTKFAFDLTDIELVSGSEITEETMAEGTYPRTVTQMLTIETNHSWRARLVACNEGEDVSWLSLSEYDHINTSMSSQANKLQIVADRNKTTSSREAFLVLMKPDGATDTLQVSQKEAVLELREPVTYSSKGKLKDLDNIRGNNSDTCFVKFVCNTAWTAKLIKASTTADATVLQPKGNDDAVVQLVFRPNLDEEKKTASLEIAAEGCGSYTINFTQLTAK